MACYDPIFIVDQPEPVVLNRTEVGLIMRSYNQLEKHQASLLSFVFWSDLVNYD